MWMYAIPGAPVGPVKRSEVEKTVPVLQYITNEMAEICITLVGVIRSVIGRPENCVSK